MSAGSCSGTPPVTQVMAVFTAGPALAAEATHVRVVLESDAFTVPLDGRNIEAEANPVRVPLVPEGGDAALDYVLTAELWKGTPDDAGAVMLAEQRVKGGFVANELREIWIEFDDTCSVACPDLFRCVNNRCVEYCVEPTPVGETTKSDPVACGEPCTAAGCFDLAEPEADVEAQVLNCNEGLRVFEKACNLGCNLDSDECGELVVSNVGAVTLQIDLLDLVLDDDAVFDTLNGTVAFVGHPDIEGIPFQGSSVPIPVCGNAAPQNYAMFLVESLRIEAGARVRASGTRPLIIVANGDIVIDGRLDASSRPGIDSGAGSCAGGQPSADPSERAGAGLGGGGGAVSGADSWSGGGGGSYGGLGGVGGEGDAGNQGGSAGMIHGATTLVPLFGGSGGGAGGDPTLGVGGAGGGAIQLSTSGRIVLGPDAAIWAGGSGGEGAFGSSSAGGGGSGGAILLESKALICPDSSSYYIGATGGGGGAYANGIPGSQSYIPAPGWLATDPPPFPAGGDGSDTDGNASPGNTGHFGTGGGGGAGRVRVNTLNGDGGVVPCGAWLQPVTFGPLDIE